MGYRSITAGTAPLLDMRDSAPVMPKCVVVDSAYDWEGDRKPAIPSQDLVIYEAHVKGMTATHPEVLAADSRQICRACVAGGDQTFDLARRQRDRIDAGASDSAGTSPGKTRAD